MNLSEIKVLWRQPDTMALYGIPYEMRPGQSPCDLWRAYSEWQAPKPGWYGSPRIELNWTWLCQPGWYGNIPKKEQAEIKAFLDANQDSIPEGPGEWISLDCKTA